SWFPPSNSASRKSAHLFVVSMLAGLAPAVQAADLHACQVRAQTTLLQHQRWLTSRSVVPLRAAAGSERPARFQRVRRPVPRPGGADDACKIRMRPTEFQGFP